LYLDRVEVWYAQQKVEEMPRLRGRSKHRVDYRHIIDWLVRKPGAFQSYRYREDLFPSSQFRMAYDLLRETRHRAPARSTLRFWNWRPSRVRHGWKTPCGFCWGNGEAEGLHSQAVEALLEAASGCHRSPRSRSRRWTWRALTRCTRSGCNEHGPGCAVGPDGEFESAASADNAELLRKKQRGGRRRRH